MSGRSKNYVTRTVADDPVNRDPDDFYPTPAAATLALLEVEKFRGRTWEPACGDGSMSRVFEEAGMDVVSSDLFDRGYGHVGVDFLRPGPFKAVDNVVTNPPFRHAEAFLHRALGVSNKKVAFLCRLAWLEGLGRYDRVFKATPIARIYVFSQRVPFARGALAEEGKGGMVAFAWYVWEKGHEGPVAIDWLRPFDK